MRTLIVAATALIVARGAQAQTPAAPAADAAVRRGSDLSAFGRLPTISKVNLAPDGTALAAEVETPTADYVIVRDIATSKTVWRMNISGSKLRALRWIDNDRLLLVQSKTWDIVGLTNPRSEWWLASQVNIRTGKGQNVLEDMFGGHRYASDTPQILNVVQGIPTVAVNGRGEKRLIVRGSSFVNHRGVPTLFSWWEGRTEVLLQGHEDTVDFETTPAGEIIGRIDSDRRSGRWSIFTGPDPYHFKLVASGQNPFGAPRFAGRSADGAALYVSVGEVGEERYQAIDLKSGAVSPAPEAFQDAELLIDADTDVVVAARHGELEGRTYHFLDSRDEALWRGVLKAFAGASVDFLGWSQDKSVLLVALFGGDWGYSYALVNRRTGKADVLFDVYDGIGPGEISPRSVVRYKAADGLEIAAYLTIPKGKGARPLPLVVLPHGGPFAKDAAGFDWWSQALASQGYVVLQPQFRGSAGFGEALLKAGYGEYGKKMQTDLSDGVAELAREGLVDPKRAAITGASYGGYAALAGVALQEGVYRCAVSVSGPSNMRRQLDYLREKNLGSDRTAGSRYWREYLGVASESDPKLDALSPDLLAQRVKAPVLLIHGQDDTIVPFDQSTRMLKALKAAGADATLVALKSEDHWLSRGETRLQMLTATVDFLKSCNPP